MCDNSRLLNTLEGFTVPLRYKPFLAQMPLHGQYLLRPPFKFDLAPFPLDSRQLFKHHNAKVTDFSIYIMILGAIIHLLEAV